MILTVVKYGHPALRKKGATIQRITEEVKKLASDMLETMYANHGVGLAAQQVGVALQLTVIDVRGVEDRPSTLEIDGKPADVSAHMPMILLNPVITPVGEPETGPEGCLSFPEIFGDITRPSVIDVTAMDDKGKNISFRCGGLLARVVQHETDHLNGILFIDRMSRKTKEEIKPELDKLLAETKAALKASA